MSLLGLHREHPFASASPSPSPSAVYISSARPSDQSHASVRLETSMEERDRPSTSRKRLRPDDISGSSFRLPQSSAIAVSNNSRLRAMGNTQQQENDSTLPTDAQAPVLETLHPPIPNFSAISQGTTRPNSMPAPAAETPSGLIYNVALPLPNPGRAHRFCQACDHVRKIPAGNLRHRHHYPSCTNPLDPILSHFGSIQINHVRRKLCTNCGAPKPSAVRNAVGVRSISEVDSTADRRPQGDMFKPDTYLQSQIPTAPFPQGGQFDMQGRLNAQGLSQGDPRFPRQADHVSYQARSLAMRSPGDDIPLLGNAQRPQSSFPGPESQTSRRMRGQAVLCEPLINFNSFGAQDNRNPGPPVRQPYGNLAEFHQKVFPNQLLDRDHFTLPSMQGIPVQKPNHNGNTNHRASPRLQTVDNRGPRHPTHLPDDALSEDVLSLNRNGGQNMDARQPTRRYQNVHGFRQYPSDQAQNQMYAGVPDTSINSGLLYNRGPEFFQPHGQFRPDDRGQILNHDTGRGPKFVQSLATSPPGEDRGFPSHPLDVHRGQAVSGLVEQPSHPNLRRGVESQQLRLQKTDEHVNVNTNHFEESNRHPDDGRLALDNILMQHKSTGHTD